MRIKSLALAAALSAFVVPHAASAALVQWNSGTGANNHYYMATEKAMSWADSNALALSMGGNIVSITSAAEQNFLQTAFLSGGNASTIYWIGLNDVATEGKYVWTTGESADYWNFAPGDPNNLNGLEDYNVMNWHYAHGYGSYGKWGDISDNGYLFKTIIEFNGDPAKAVPAPAPLALLATGLISITLLRRRKEPV